MSGDMTPMERHAALGPIAWAQAGMRATTRDGYVVEVHSRHLDAVAEAYTVVVDGPPDHLGRKWRSRGPAKDITAARALAAEIIGWERDAETRRAEAVGTARAWVLAVSHRVMAAAERGVPRGTW